MEISSENSGTLLATSFALGTKEGKAFMLVNGCQNPKTTVMIKGEKVMTPGASSFIGMQFAKPYFKPSTF